MPYLLARPSCSEPFSSQHYPCDRHRRRGGKRVVRFGSQEGIGAVTVGHWTAFPDLGTPQADPYSKARIAREGVIVARPGGRADIHRPAGFGRRRPSTGTAPKRSRAPSRPPVCGHFTLLKRPSPHPQRTSDVSLHCIRSRRCAGPTIPSRSPSAAIRHQATGSRYPAAGR